MTEAVPAPQKSVFGPSMQILFLCLAGAALRLSLSLAMRSRGGISQYSSV